MKSMINAIQAMGSWKKYVYFLCLSLCVYKVGNTLYMCFHLFSCELLLLCIELFIEGVSGKSCFQLG